MGDTTPVFGLPYPVVGDPPAGHLQIQALAEAVEQLLADQQLATSPQTLVSTTTTADTATLQIPFPADLSTVGAIRLFISGRLATSVWSPIIGRFYDGTGTSDSSSVFHRGRLLVQDGAGAVQRNVEWDSSCAFGDAGGGYYNLDATLTPGTVTDGEFCGVHSYSAGRLAPGTQSDTENRISVVGSGYYANLGAFSAGFRVAATQGAAFLAGTRFYAVAFRG